MPSYLAKMFDAPQRRVDFTDLQTSHGVLTHLQFHIQGISYVKSGKQYDNGYCDMVDMGIKRWEQPRLTILQRLWRKPAVVGTLSQINPENIIVTLWTDPELSFVLDAQMEGMPDKWKTCYGIIHAAGFELKKE